jgi:hypothetical protein
LARRAKDMKSHLPHLIVTTSLAALACSVFVGGPDLPDPVIPNASEPLQTLQNQLQQAVVESAGTGNLRLEITQEQMTAYLASRLSSQDPPILTDPQVVLTDQRMILYGKAQSGMFEANVALTALFSVDADGKPQIALSQAEIGPLPMPQPLRDGIAAAVDEALTGYIGPAAIGFRLEGIEIREGVMTITGRLR